MRSNKRPLLRPLLRVLALASSPLIDARGPSRLRLRVHRLRAQTAPLGAELERALQTGAEA
jgi:hypothetical protein